MTLLCARACVCVFCVFCCKDGTTALFIAAQCGHEATLGVLLGHIADNPPSPGGLETGSPPTAVAASVAWAAAGAMAGVVDRPGCAGWTPLLVSAAFGQKAAVAQLLSAGADPRCKARAAHLGVPAGETPAGAAARRGHTALATRLREAEAAAEAAAKAASPPLPPLPTPPPPPCSLSQAPL